MARSCLDTPTQTVQTTRSTSTGDLTLPLEAELAFGPLTPGTNLAPFGACALGLFQRIETSLPVGLLQFQLSNVQPELGATGLSREIAVDLRRFRTLACLPPEHAQTLTPLSIAG